MERSRIAAADRETGRKGILNQLRSQGRVPAILYGRGTAPQPLSIQEKELMHLLKSQGMNALIELELKDRKEKSPLVVMVKDLQKDVLSHKVTHVDLLKVDMKEKVTVAVAVRLTGKAIGLTKGGLIDQPARELEIRCLPGSIPESIEVDITPLDIGDSIHLKDLKLPPGVEATAEQTVTVVSIVAPREEPAPEAAPAAEATAAPAEGAPAQPQPAEGAAASKKEEKAEKKG